MNGQYFYICSVCGTSLAGMSTQSGSPVYCCNREMQRLHANEGSAPNGHMINARIEGNKIHVSIGDEGLRAHQMKHDHHIEWIYLHTQESGQRKRFRPGMEPAAVFSLKGTQSAILYAYCSQHGLWTRALSSPSTPE